MSATFRSVPATVKLEPFGSCPTRMSDPKFLKARRARYVLVREVIARLVSDLAYTESEAASALSGCLADAGERAPTWFNIQGLDFSNAPDKMDPRDGIWMLQELQISDTPYDPRLGIDVLLDRYRLPSGGIDEVDFLDHNAVCVPYHFGCFLVAEIEPVLRDAELLVEAPVSSGISLAKTGKQKGKLTAVQVQKLDRLRKACEKENLPELASELAAEFGVTRQAIKKRLDKAEALEKRVASQSAWLPRLATK